jgi:hypothetical protein
MLSSGLSTIRILEIAFRSNSLDLVSSFWPIFMEEFKERRWTPKQAIDLAELLDDREQQGEVYYETMVRGKAEWEAAGLTERQLNMLRRGFVACVEAFDDLAKYWSNTLALSHVHWTEYSSSKRCALQFGQHVLRACVAKSIPYCDIIRRLELAISFSHQDVLFEHPMRAGGDHNSLTQNTGSCHKFAIAHATKELAAAKEGVANYFFDPIIPCSSA